MNERDTQRSPGEPRPNDPTMNQHQYQEHQASTDVQQGIAGGAAGSQGSSPPFGSSGLQSMPGQAGGEGMEQQATQRQQQAVPATPMVDVVEAPEELIVYVDTPGYEKDDINIHADANTLAVSADRSSKPSFDEDEGERGLVIERPMKLERTIPLPVHIDADEASASYDDGVCKITIPKEEGEKRSEIGFQ